MTVLPSDLSLKGLFFPCDVAPLPPLVLVLSQVVSEPPSATAKHLNSFGDVLELEVCENDDAVVDEQEDDDFGGLAWISVIIRAWLE